MDMTHFWGVLISIITLTVLEIVLGIDNLVFISIVSSRLPKHKQKLARRFGLLLALGTRLLLLASVVWLIGLTKPLINIFSQEFSGRDLILVIGGVFLIFKSTMEIHAEFATKEEKEIIPKYSSFFGVVAQIAILDIIFSLDSVMTAVGLTQTYWVMALAIFIAILAMIFVSEPISKFIHDHPSIKMLALSFLLLIGTVLIADGFEVHIPRGYIYFALSFSLFVEVLNSIILHRKKRNPDKTKG